MNKELQAFYRGKRESAKRVFARFAFKEAKAPTVLGAVDYYFRILAGQPPTALRVYVSHENAQIRLIYEAPTGAGTLCTTFDATEIENILTDRFRLFSPPDTADAAVSIDKTRKKKSTSKKKP